MTGILSVRLFPEPATETPLPVISHWLFWIVVALPSARFDQLNVLLLASHSSLPGTS